MLHFKRSSLFLLVSLLLTGILVLTPLGAGQTQKSKSKPFGQEKKSDQGTDEDAENVDDKDDKKGAGDETPCNPFIDPPGNAKGLEKKCARGGSSSGIAKGDFNGDGYGDLAIGSPFQEVGDQFDAGAVNVIYGSSDGLCANGPCAAIAAQLWSQESSGIQGDSETGDHFGSALASGDFNHDGCSDLAIGVPGEDITRISGLTRPVTDGGAVNVIFGSTNQGLVAVSTGSATCGRASGVPSPEIFTFNDLWVAFPPLTIFDASYHFQAGDDDSFGTSLAWGDFDHDGYGDLAVGIPYWDVQQDSMNCNPIIGEAGGVGIFHGSSEGLQNGGDLWTQHGPAITVFNDEGLGLFCPNGDLDLLHEPFISFSPVAVGPDTLKGAPENNDYFGQTLAAGDFNHDLYTDLAIGVPGENIGSAINCGAVNVIYGGPNGLESNGNQFWSQGESGIKDTLESDDRFGQALAAGDFNGDRRDDLAIGVSLEDIGSIDDAGGVNILYGSGDGLTDVGDQFFNEDNLFTFSEIQAGARFGFALAVGDFNADGNKDLAIGAPFHDITKDGTKRAGAGHVVIVYGLAGSGLAPDSRKLIGQGLPLNLGVVQTGTVTGDPERDDHFGWSLSAWNFGRSAHADLAIGVPDEGLSDTGSESGNTILAAGQVQVLYGFESTAAGTSGLYTAGQQRWTKASPGVPGVIAWGDRFGRAVY